MPYQLSLANFSRRLTSFFTQKRYISSKSTKSSKSKKNKSVTKIQSAFRGHRTRQQLRTQKTAKQEALDSKKIETEAERLFNNANKTNAKKALIKMVRDTDAESIEIMLYELWAELSVKKRETWLAKARKNLTKY